MGWRYVLFILGSITLLLWAARFFFFTLVESPRYLIGKGRDEEAVAVVHRIAEYNGKTSSLTVEQLTVLGSMYNQDTRNRRSKWSLSRTSDFTLKHIKALFRTTKIAYSTSLMISIWGNKLLIFLSLSPVWLNCDSNIQALLDSLRRSTTISCPFCEYMSYNREPFF